MGKARGSSRGRVRRHSGWQRGERRAAARGRCRAAGEGLRSGCGGAGGRGRAAPRRSNGPGQNGDGWRRAVARFPRFLRYVLPRACGEQASLRTGAGTGRGGRAPPPSPATSMLRALPIHAGVCPVLLWAAVSSPRRSPSATLTFLLPWSLLLCQPLLLSIVTLPYPR